MRRRLACGEALFHPDDNPAVDPSPERADAPPDAVEPEDMPDGIKWDKQRRQFRVRCVGADGVYRRHGRYDTLEEAIEVLERVRSGED